MTLRKRIKHWVYGSCPGVAGSFRYFGTRVYFPRKSLSFTAACQQGIFEHQNVRLLQSLVRPDTCYFDVGANIGLMAIPILSDQPTCRVISFEPSPNVLPYLRRTVGQSAHRSRWQLVEKAVSAEEGAAQFTLSDPRDSLFDGLRATNRVGVAGLVDVERTTLDRVWRDLGTPAVSVIKCDVEGAEMDVLEGARDCLRANSPAVLLEWNATNLAAYGRAAGDLLDFARREQFKLLSLPGLVRVRDCEELDLHMVLTESFLLLPERNEAVRCA